MKRCEVSKYVILINVCLTLVLFPVQAFPSDSEIPSGSELMWVLQRIKMRERNLNTCTATFIQVKKTSLLKEPLHSEGILYFDRSGKMLVKISSPSPLIVVLKAHTLVTFYPDLSKTEELYLGSTHDIFRDYFGIGQSIEEMQTQYAIHLDPKTDSDAFRLRLIPKKKPVQAHIKQIDVVVSPKHWLPERVTIIEVKGDTTSISLQFTSINEPLPSGIFTLDIPSDSEKETSFSNQGEARLSRLLPGTKD